MATTNYERVGKTIARRQREEEARRRTGDAVPIASATGTSSQGGSA